MMKLSLAGGSMSPLVSGAYAMATYLTVADLQRNLGNVPPERIRLQPLPGTATVVDVERAAAVGEMPCELIDGVLVEKTMGWYESLLAAIVVGRLQDFLKSHDLGKVLGADATLQIRADQVRIPDACFISWERFVGRQLPTEAIPMLIPDLVVEIISASNTADEMQRKLDEYFQAGVRLVWYIHPATRTAELFTSPDCKSTIASSGSLHGGDVLPGFELPLSELFEEADRVGPK
jgi:Uma2 family endonuclease